MRIENGKYDRETCDEKKEYCFVQEKTNIINSYYIDQNKQRIIVKCFSVIFNLKFHNINFTAKHDYKLSIHLSCMLVQN
jgi:hypothetical protein